RVFLPRVRPSAGYRDGVARGSLFIRCCESVAQHSQFLLGEVMHKVGVRQEVIDRVMKRRGKVHVFDDYHPKKTALVVIDMQGTFCDEGAPAEVATSRGIVPNLNKLTPKLRELGVPVMWVLHANSNFKGESDWDMFYNYFVSGDIRARTIEANSPENQAV